MLTAATENMLVEKPTLFQKIGTFFSKYGKIIMNIIIIAIPIIIVYIYMTSADPADVKQTLKDNKKLEHKIDSIRLDNQFLVKRMYEVEKNQIQFYDLINKNNNLIQANNKELLDLKRLYNAKINSVSSYSISQLDSFFTNRYKEFY